MAAPSDLVLGAAEVGHRLRALDAAVRTETGHEAFADGLWRAIEREPQHCTLDLSPTDDVGVVAFPSDTFQPPHRQLAVGMLQSAPLTQLERSVDQVLQAVDGDRVVAWLPGSDPRITSALQARAFVVDRRQHQMQVDLPVAEPAKWPDGVMLRAFVPGQDESAWLGTNNRAFRNHDDQGGWVERTLERRMAEPWFDPAGFLLAWRGVELVGFCWTKVATAGVGEIFVIGVDPDAQGLGLGRALVVAGLDHLAAVRGCATGMLYVAADNAPAVALYQSLGFAVHRTDIALVRSEKDA